MRRFILLLFIFQTSTNAFSQAELKQITPLSPNAAAIAKYGETPVSYFTGVPSISIPLFNIKGKQLGMPLGLSYHAGGHKVEDMASWVGLGWSLGSVPVISRGVRGIPDEAAGGWFSLYSGKTVAQLYDNRFGTSTEQAQYAAYLDDVRSGSADSEPDIFSYSLLNKNGKFYYNQASSQFYTIPYENIKIERITNGFRIISDDGVIHDFTVPEYSYSGLSQSVNSWWASKIVDANHNDSISFEYTVVTESVSVAASVSKNIYLSGGTSCNFPQFESSQVSPTIYANKPDKISFSAGYVKFVPQSANRVDVPGSKALDKIQLYNYRDELIKQFKFEYSYHNSRLLLDKFWEQDALGNSLSPHLFSYRTDISLSSGEAQDYWGFYNGAITNVDLIPSILYTMPGNSYKSLLTGADRTVHPQHTQFSLLQKVTYPTGGSTSYEFEQNETSDTNFPIQTKDTSVVVSGNGTGQGMYGAYEKTFTMDIPPDAFINDNQGGAFVKVVVGNLGCDLSGGLNLCANVYIADVNGFPVTSSFTGNVDGFYLPNGTYKLKAEFYQDPEQYQNFYFGLLWNKPDSNFTGKRFVGGVRVKKIADYDGIDHARDRVRIFYYTQDDTSSVSSGNVFGLPYFNFTETLTYTEYSSQGEGCGQCYSNLLKRSSYSNVSAVSHSGSFVGYKRVRVDQGTMGDNGRSVYNFTNEIDIAATFFPYPPAISREQRRGLLLESVDYKKAGSIYFPIKRLINSYTTYLPYTATGINNSLTSALKIAIKDVVVDNCNQLTQRAEQITYPYTLQSDWMQLAKTEEKTYDSNDTLKSSTTITKFDYHGNYLQVKEVKTYASNGDSLLSLPKYAYDLSLNGTAETARLALLSQNRMGTVLQQLKKTNNVQKQLLQTSYKEVTTGKVEPSDIEVQVEANLKQTRVQFNAYDTDGNIAEQQKSADAKISYLYDYKGNYPVAEIINAAVDAVAYTSFEAEAAGNWSGMSNGNVQTGGGLTGSKYYSQTGFGISKSGLNTSSYYTISYWSKNGAYSVSGTQSGYPKTGQVITIGSATWTLYEHLVTGQATITVSGSGAIDELRLYPQNAQMKTYTFLPLVGITSHCDASNRLSFYEYDSLGRLQVIRGQDQQIVKKYDYKYWQ